MNNEAPKKKGFFSKIASRDDALEVVKDTSNAFFFLAALQAALAYWVGLSMLFDAAVYAVGGFFLRRYQSRTAAVILLLLAVAGAGITVANRVGQNLGGGNNIILAIIVLWAAVRAVQATFKLRGRFSQESLSESPGA